MLLFRLEHALRPAPDRRLAPAHPADIEFIQPPVRTSGRAYRRVCVCYRLERDGCGRVLGWLVRRLFWGFHGEYDGVLVDGAERAGHERVQRVRRC